MFIALLHGNVTGAFWLNPVLFCLLPYFLLLMIGAFSQKAKTEHNLLVVPGEEFECEGYMRLSYCVSNAMIRRSLPAFQAMIDSYRK